MIAYLIKASIILTIFFVFYKIFLERESFFAKNRMYLLFSLLFSFTLPFVTLPELIQDQGFISKMIEQYIYEEPSDKQIESRPQIDNLDKNDAEIVISESIVAENIIDKASEINAVERNAISPSDKAMKSGENADMGSIYSKNNVSKSTNKGFSFWLLSVYFFGVFILTINIIAQIGSILFRAIKSKDKVEDFDCTIINSSVVTEPCSFFKYVFINPESYDYETYEQILAHEKIHARKFHTLDLLLSEIAVILLWFNPISWLFRKEIEKNIEFQTDDLLLNEEKIERENYQMSLLKIATYQRPLAITTNYNQSLIKQRILKMSAKKSNPYSYWKYAFIVPVVFSILLATNSPNIIVAQKENKDLAFSKEEAVVSNEKHFNENKESAIEKDSVEVIQLDTNEELNVSKFLEKLSSLSKEDKLKVLKALKELDTEEIKSNIENSNAFEELREEDRSKAISDLENLKILGNLKDLQNQHNSETEVEINISDDDNSDVEFEDLEPEMQSEIVEALSSLDNLKDLADLDFLEDLKELEKIAEEELVYNINPNTKVIITESDGYSNKKNLKDNNCKKLINAIRKGDLEEVKNLLKTVNSNCVDPAREYENIIVDGDVWSINKPRTPLVAAARKGFVEIGELLIKNDAEVDLHDNDQETPLIAASTYGQTAFVSLLLKNGADINSISNSQGTALIAASRNGKVETVKLLLDNGADINAINNGQGSALIAASRNGEIPTVKLLLENGADINAMNNGQGSALNAASRNGETETMKLLLENGADINAMNNGQGSALNAAARNGETETVKLLLENGADINAMNNGQGSALNAAARNGEIATVKLLLENGADINAMNNGQGSALNAAARNGELETVKLLIENGADVNAENYGQGSALNAAARNGELETVKLLVSEGADVNLDNKSQGTALGAAKRNGHKDVMKYLISQGANRK